MNQSDTFANMFQSLNMLFEASLSQVNHTLQNLSLLQENNTQELIYNSNSCASILLFAPSFPSGDYWIRFSNGSGLHVYCDMNRSCGIIIGGWMRVAELDMTGTTILCPSNLMLQTEDSSRIMYTIDQCSSLYFSLLFYTQSN